MPDGFSLEPVPVPPSSSTGVPFPVTDNGKVTEARREPEAKAGRLRLAELQETLTSVEPAAVLVAPRVLERVIRQVYDLPGIAWHVPHRASCIVDRHVLFRHVEQDELEIAPEQLLPPTVILLARPSPENLSAPRPSVLRTYWRRLFHASVHLTLQQRATEENWGPTELQSRIHALGPAEFDEIRAVLLQDRYLPPKPDDRAVYFEFAAVYLEWQRFAPGLVAAYFPGLRDLSSVDALLAQDVDADGLLLRTRLPGAAEAVPRREGDEEATDYYRRLIRDAAAAEARGNLVRSAIDRTRAARVAPAVLVRRTLDWATTDLQRLTVRLRQALMLTEAEANEWLRDLPALLDKADQGQSPPEAALLFDLQKICLDHERPLYTLGINEWIFSAGRRPIKRPLPCQRMVRTLRHLHSATSRLRDVRLADADRQHLAHLLRQASLAAEERMRSRFRPIITDSLHDVGLAPGNALEQTAFEKMVEEMLDRIASYGFLTFGDLRDTISRNSLKLPDLSDPPQFIAGDPLLRLDRRLAALLDGVYRPSEVYMRGLERLTALNFGTATGRLLTRYLTVPFGGAFVLCKAVTLALGEMHVEVSTLAQMIAFAVTGFLLLGLFHSASLRQGIAQALASAGRSARALFIDLPARVVPLAWLRRALTSWPAQLCYWYVVKPAVVCAILWLCLPAAFATAFGAVCVFVAVNFVLNARVGQAASQLVVSSLVSFYELLRAGLLPGLIRLIVSAFKQAVDAMDSLLFSVDEWLCFRSGDGWPSLVVRAILSVLWAPISYVARIYMLVLVEPAINPVKMPASYIAAKLMVAFEPAMIAFGVGLLSPVTGAILANIIVWPTVWLSPDAFGFLFWEMKENWYLYRANRSPALRPVPVGPHNETMVQLLRPGFHSGTVPRLFSRLRHAERTTGSRAAESCKQSLHEIEVCVRLFVVRELAALLRQAPAWQRDLLSVGRVELSCNCIRVELRHSDFPNQVTWLTFENRARWLVAGFQCAGWLPQLSREQRTPFVAALAMLYKLAGVDLVREQLAVSFPTAHLVDIGAQGLVAWLDGGHALAYDLTAPGPVLPARDLAGSLPISQPAINASSLIFARTPLSWKDCAAAWPDEPAMARASSLLLPA